MDLRKLHPIPSGINPDLAEEREKTTFKQASYYQLEISNMFFSVHME